MIANLAELVSRAADAAPEKSALVSGETGLSMTWREVEDAVDRFASGLSAQGLVAGNRVAIVVANRIEFVIVYLGVLRARLVAVPINPRSATGELVRTLADSGARLVVTDATTVASVRAAVTGVREALSGASAGAEDAAVGSERSPRLVVIDSMTEPGELAFPDLMAAEPAALPDARDPEALAVLLYTSGTSGRPRAAMLSHRALLANLDQAAAVEPPMVTSDDVVYGVLPLFHVYGLNAVLGQVVHARATLVVVDGFDAIESLAQIERHGVTILPVAPPVLAYWRGVPEAAQRLSGVRTVMSGSAPLSPDLAGEFAERLGMPVHQGYGLTEAAPVVTSTLASAASGRAVKPGSVGSALPGITVKLVDEAGHAPEGEDPGEIWVSGANLFDGYWPDRADGPVDGWLATGDVGFIDGDGDLFLVDRLKELIIVSGFNVYPSEIEELLVEVEDILEAAVVGVPDEHTGEAVVAYVRVADADQEQVPRVREQAESLCATRLARFKQPVRIEVVDTLPHTVTGKLARGLLRATVRRRATGLLE